MGDARGAGGRRRTRRAALAGVARRVVPGLAATLLLLLLQAADFGVFHRLGDMVFDTFQRAAPRPYKPTPVRVVDIDDETLRRLGQWPWPRTEVARLTQLLADAGAAAIAYDVVFSEPDRTSPGRIAAILRANPDAKGDYADVARLTDHDVLLGRTFAKTPAITGVFLTREANATRPVSRVGFAFTGPPPWSAVPAFAGAITPIPAIGASAAGTGFVSLVGDRDGIIRRAPLLARIGDQMVPSLSIEALRVAQGAGAIVVKSSGASGEGGGGAPATVGLKVGDFAVPTTPAGELWMHFTRPTRTPRISAWRLLSGAIPPARLQQLFGGTIVFVGTGAAGLRDVIATPVADRELGVMVHAEAAEQMILGDFLSRPDWATGLERLLVILLGIGLSCALPWLGAGWGGLVGAGALAGVGAGSWWAFRDEGLLVDPTYPTLAVVLAYLTVTVSAFYREERQRAYIHRAFDRYLSPELVRQIARDPSSLELGGEDRDMSVLFCDIRGFSRLSEKMSPRGTIRFLISFLTPMTDILIARRATIDKYIGDAILAFWNAPLDDPDHPRNAALGALAMLDALKQLNAGHADDPDWPGEVKIGVGINSGMCCVGNMGSAQRLSYSLIGDTVNLASRLEGLTKQYRVPILVGEATAARIADFALVEADLATVVGRVAPERLHAVLGDPAAAVSPEFRRVADRHGAMLTAYRAQDWNAADQLAAEQQEDAAAGPLAGLASVYRERIAGHRRAPPPPDWDGVHHATEK